MKTIYVQEYSGPNIFELPDLDDAVELEVRPGSGEKPKAFCTRCNINWSCLKTVIDEQNDESYDICPVCATDAYLEDYRVDEDGFISSPFTCELKNTTAGKAVVKEPDYNDEPYAEREKFNYEEYEARKERDQQLHDLAIEEYHNVFATHGQQAAEQAFFNKIEQFKKKINA